MVSITIKTYDSVVIIHTTSASLQTKWVGERKNRTLAEMIIPMPSNLDLNNISRGEAMSYYSRTPIEKE